MRLVEQDMPNTYLLNHPKLLKEFVSLDSEFVFQKTAMNGWEAIGSLLTSRSRNRSQFAATPSKLDFRFEDRFKHWDWISDCRSNAGRIDITFEACRRALKTLLPLLFGLKPSDDETADFVRDSLAMEQMRQTGFAWGRSDKQRRAAGDSIDGDARNIPNPAIRQLELATLLLERKGEDVSSIDFASRRDAFAGVMNAIVVPIGCAFGWISFLLTFNPQLQTRLSAEAKSFFDEPKVGDQRMLQLTRSVVRESLRLFPVSWLLKRRVLSEVEVGNVTIETNSEIWICPFLLHRKVKFWNRPFRFEPGKREKCGSGHGCFYPFGLGKRMCPASQLASEQLVFMLAGSMLKSRIAVTNVDQIRLSPSISLQTTPRMQVKISKCEN